MAAGSGPGLRCGARRFGGPGAGEAVRRGLAEGCHQAAAVADVGGEHDMARLDAMQGDRGEVGAEAPVG